MPRRKREYEVEPEVEQVFNKVWGVFTEAVEVEVIYDVEAPVVTETVLRELEELMFEELKDELDEALSGVLCDACYCVPQHFLNYAFSERLPSRQELEDCISEYMEGCGETRETIDEFVECVNERYDCFLLLNKFFTALPDLLEVKVVEGDILPDLCKVSGEEVVENAVWYIGLKAGDYGTKVDEDYYGVRDGRIMMVGFGIGGSWCSEGFERDLLPKIAGRIKELSERPDLTVYVYGKPPIEPKTISPSLVVRGLNTPPKP